MFAEFIDWCKTTNWVDWAFALSVLYGAALGFKRGLSHELGVLIATLVALVAVRAGYAPLADRIAVAADWNPLVARLVAVVVIWCGAMLAMWMLGKALGALMDFHFKGWPERIGGLLTGAVRRVVIFSVVLLMAYFLVQANWLQRAIRYDSRVGSALLPVLIDGYNAVAERAAFIQAEEPTGVRLVMPPREEPAPAASAASAASADYPLPPLED
jgi:uncharacterized membrane protein required for colicin V production